MKKIFFSVALLTASFTIAQNTGINTTSPNATLDIKGKPTDTTVPDGIIPPQLTRAQLIAKTAYGVNQKGAVVYVTDLSGMTNTSTSKVDKVGYYYFDGTAWQKAGGDDWSLTGNAGTDPKSNFLGTNDNQDIAFRRNNQAIGLLGFNNIAFGLGALNPFTTGELLIGIGNSALGKNSTGVANVAVGSYSLSANTVGSGNTALGFNSLPMNTEGEYNTSIGLTSMRSNLSGRDNVAIGRNALYDLTDGQGNTAVGSASMDDISSGDYNTSIGFFSLNKLNGSHNIGIGAFSDVPDSSGSYQLSIGNSIYGFNINDGISYNDLIGISAIDPTERLDVNGNIKVRGTGEAIEDGFSCSNYGTISYGADGNFYGCTGAGVWKKLHN